MANNSSDVQYLMKKLYTLYKKEYLLKYDPRDGVNKKLNDFYMYREKTIA